MAGLALLQLASAVVSPGSIERFGVAAHYTFQPPYGRDNQPFGPWPVNTTEQLRVLHRACGGPDAKRRCVYKTDWPGDVNASDVHVGYMHELVAAAKPLGIEVMAIIGTGGDWGGESGEGQH